MIYICEYDNMADDQTLRECCEALLLPFGGEKQTGTAGWERHRERILARLVLNLAVWREYGLSAAKLDLQRHESGKLYSRAYPQIKFNLSHCDTACACVTGGCEAGIDVERKFDYREKLAKKVCHPGEYALLEGMRDEEKKEQLRYLWSLKESFVKWHGKGLAYGMNRVNFARYLPLAPGMCLEAGSAFGTDGPEERYPALKFLLQDKQTCTMAVCAERMDAEIIQVTEQDVQEVWEKSGVNRCHLL